MLIRDQLDTRIYVALLIGPATAYEIITRVKNDGGVISPVEERTIYRRLPKLTINGSLKMIPGIKPPRYQLEAKTKPILKAHLQQMIRLENIVKSRL